MVWSKRFADYKAKHFSRGNKSTKSTYFWLIGLIDINFVSICVRIVEESRINCTREKILKLIIIMNY